MLRKFGRPKKTDDSMRGNTNQDKKEQWKATERISGVKNNYKQETITHNATPRRDDEARRGGNDGNPKAYQRKEERMETKHN